MAVNILCKNSYKNNNAHLEFRIFFQSAKLQLLNINEFFFFFCKPNETKK